MIRKCTTLFFIFLFSTALLSQTVVKVSLTPYGVTPFMTTVSTTDIYDYTYTGLQNVGVGTKVYLMAAINGKKFGTPVFSWVRKPVGATAAVNVLKDVKNDSTQIVFFTADFPGAYEIKIADGPYISTLVINAAKYLGYKNTVVNGVDTKLNCGTCHSSYVANWEKTNHSSLFTKAMSATPGISGPADHYSANCVKCHTTGYDANPTAKNDGFDDLGFVYPTTITSATYNALLTQFPEAMKRANIQCESCHGPAGGHLGVTTDQRINVTYDPSVCAWCHESGTNHIIGREFRTAMHASPVDESGSGRESCVRCHTGKGFAQFANNIPTTDPYFDVEFYPISCAGCHDPHNAKNEKQLRMDVAKDAATGLITIANHANTGVGALCVNCHQSRRDMNLAVDAVVNKTSTSLSNSHNSPQGDIFLGINLFELGGVPLQKTKHKEMTQALGGCAACHMYNGDILDANKNLIEWGGHTFNMSTKKKDANGNYVIDPVTKLKINDKDHVAACAQCHGATFSNFKGTKFYMNGTGDFDLNGVTDGLNTEMSGMIKKVMDELIKQIPGVAISTSSSTLGWPTPSQKWTKVQLQAYWNCYTISRDRSSGMHNPKFVVTGLQGAMAAIGLKIALNVTAVKDEAMPTEYALFQNYPNPFNPTTTIKFALPKSGAVKLTVYDIAGKEVETLVNANLNAGTHNIQFNASSLASGVYLYRIQADNFVKVSKMLLVK